MAAVATMTAVKEVHADARKWQKPDEPVADENVCPMLGDEQKSRHGKEADDCHTHRRPPKGLRYGMFIRAHTRSDPAIVDTIRLETVAT